jgi:hypothetical protein
MRVEKGDIVPKYLKNSKSRQTTLDEEGFQGPETTTNKKGFY